MENRSRLISAPAGFGKTTLLCQWLEQCPLPNAWLQLDENDSELSFFIAGVISALRQIFPTACPESAKLVLASQPAPHAAWVNALLSDIEALGERPFVLALDDFHLLHNPNIDLLLADILQHAPLSLHLMIAARRSPSLAFSRLKVQENAVEIRTADLRFNNVEAASFFDQAIAAPLKEEALLQLQLKVEGWAAGLTLAAISMREETSPEDLIMRLDGSHRRVSDYLLDQALNDQPLEIQDYLLKSSFLNRFCAPLCQAVMDAPITPAQSQTLLEQIERSQLFLIPLDDQRHWYRYHHLFQKMLYAHMQLYQSPQEIEQLRRRAAKWLEGEGLFDEAIEQLTILQDWANAARLVERGLCNQLNREDRRGIQRRLERFPPEFIQTRPGLLLMQAWIAHFDLQIARISRLTDQIQEILDNIITGSGNERMEPVQTGFEEMSSGGDSGPGSDFEEPGVLPDQPGQRRRISGPPGAHKASNGLGFCARLGQTVPGIVHADGGSGERSHPTHQPGVRNQPGTAQSIWRAVVVLPFHDLFSNGRSGAVQADQ